VEYIHVSEPDDYTRQKQAETEPAIDEIGSEDTTGEAAAEEPEATTEETESATAETESG
jgi:hypothetical protein